MNILQHIEQMVGLGGQPPQQAPTQGVQSISPQVQNMQNSSPTYSQGAGSSQATPNYLNVPQYRWPNIGGSAGVTRDIQNSQSFPINPQLPTTWQYFNNIPLQMPEMLQPSLPLQKKLPLYIAGQQ